MVLIVCRCNKLKKRCVFFHIPKDPATEYVLALVLRLLLCS